MNNCIFQENELLVGGNLNKTKLVGWISAAGNAEDPLIMAYIDHCESIGTKIALTLEYSVYRDFRRKTPIPLGFGVTLSVSETGAIDVFDVISRAIV